MRICRTAWGKGQVKSVEKRINYEFNYLLLLLSKCDVGKLNIIANSLNLHCIKKPLKTWSEQVIAKNSSS